MNGFVNDRWHKGKGKDRVRTARYGVGARWQAVWIAPNGKQKSKSFENADQARNFLEQVNVHKMRGSYIDPEAGKMLLTEYVENHFLPHRRGKENTEIARKNNWEFHIKPFLGDFPLTSITPNIVQAWLRDMDNKGLKLSSQRIYRILLSQIMRSAIDDSRLSKNPLEVRATRLATAPKTKLVPWTYEQVQAVHEHMDERFAILPLLGGMLGLRQGEALGLAIEDVNFLKQTVHIRRQIKRINGKLIFAPTKTQNERTVPLPKVLASALSAHIQKFPPVAVTLPWDRTDGKEVTVNLISTNESNLAISSSNFNDNQWKPAIKRAGLIGDLDKTGFHQLRHTYASIFLQSGGQIRALSEYLGHANHSMTLNVYAHFIPSDEQKVRDALNVAFKIG